MHLIFNHQPRYDVKVFPWDAFKPNDKMMKTIAMQREHIDSGAIRLILFHTISIN